MLLQYKGTGGITVTPLNNSTSVVLATNDIINVTDAQGQALLNMFSDSDFIEINDIFNFLPGTPQTSTGSPEGATTSRYAGDCCLDTSATPKTLYMNPTAGVNTGWQAFVTATP